MKSKSVVDKIEDVDDSEPVVQQGERAQIGDAPVYFVYDATESQCLLAAQQTHPVPNMILMIPGHHLATVDLFRWTLVQPGMKAQLYVWTDDLANIP